MVFYQSGTLTRTATRTKGIVFTSKDAKQGIRKVLKFKNNENTPNTKLIFMFQLELLIFQTFY